MLPGMFLVSLFSPLCSLTLIEYLNLFSILFVLDISPNTCCFQILIARGASLNAENDNEYVHNSLIAHFLFDVLQFSDVFPLDGLFIIYI